MKILPLMAVSYGTQEMIKKLEKSGFSPICLRWGLS